MTEDELEAIRERAGREYRGDAWWHLQTDIANLILSVRSSQSESEILRAENDRLRKQLHNINEQHRAMSALEQQRMGRTPDLIFGRDAE